MNQAGRGAQDPMPSGRPDIKAVARLAGVAISSVSRVLSGHPDVSEAMRRKVLAAVEAVGYEPDPLAQGLRRGRTHTVGFLMSDISNPIFGEMAVAAEIVLQQAGYAVLLANSLAAPEQDAAQLRVLKQRRVDGMILSLADERDDRTIEALTSLDRPYVLLDRDVDGLPGASAVLSEHRTGMRDAVAHLLELGHRHIGFLGGAPTNRPTRERVKALRAATRGGKAAVTVDWATPRRPQRYTVRTFYAQHARKAALRIIDRPDRPTAIIAGGTLQLIGILTALKDRGLRVPDDISLITCEHTPARELLEPALAVVGRDCRAIGAAAADLLLRGLRNEEPATILLPVSYVPGASCAPPRAASSGHG